MSSCRGPRHNTGSLKSLTTETGATEHLPPAAARVQVPCLCDLVSAPASMAYCGLARSSIARVGGRRWQGTKRVVGQLTVRPMVTGTATAGRGGPKAACVRRIARGCSDAYEGAAVVVASGRRVAIANTWAPSESLQRRHSSAAGVDGARVTALYAGSFDPPTVGHIDIIRRSLAFCDRLIVAVALNPGKKYVSVPPVVSSGGDGSVDMCVTLQLRAWHHCKPSLGRRSLPKTVYDS